MSPIDRECTSLYPNCAVNFALNRTVSEKFFIFCRKNLLFTHYLSFIRKLEIWLVSQFTVEQENLFCGNIFWAFSSYPNTDCIFGVVEFYRAMHYSVLHGIGIPCVCLSVCLSVFNVRELWLLKLTCIENNYTTKLNYFGVMAHRNHKPKNLSLWKLPIDLDFWACDCTIAQIYRAISSQLRHVSTIGKTC